MKATKEPPKQSRLNKPVDLGLGGAVQIMPSKTSTIIYNPSNCTSFKRSFDTFIKVLINGKLIEIY